jgi:hypothetical protein
MKKKYEENLDMHRYEKKSFFYMLEEYFNGNKQHLNETFLFRKKKGVNVI